MHQRLKYLKKKSKGLEISELRAKSETDSIQYY